MLTRFEVANFKNFDKRTAIDFSDVRDYQFNANCIKDGLLNKVIIYGKNASGKTNIGLALFDIVSHLTEKNVTRNIYDSYLNADSTSAFAEFHYNFRFGSSEVSYVYRKSENRALLYEQVTVDDKLLFTYNFTTKYGDFEPIKEAAPTLNFDFMDDKLSVLRYIVSNTKSNAFAPLTQLVQFVSRMLWFRSLDENRYIGYKTASTDYLTFISENENLTEFEKMLHIAGIHEKLVMKTNPSGKKELYFDRATPLPFFSIASNGTKALYTLFYWLKTSDDLSLLFIDEFDAFYHAELSEVVAKMLEERAGFQTILTSHNTNLLTNRIMRPDCYFILSPERLVSFANATERELREGHNLAKLYLSGEFDGK